MAVPDVDKKLLEELESMGFPVARATRALHYSGNFCLEDAINWVIEHENDPDIDQMPLLPIEIKIETGKLSWFSEEIKMNAEKLSRERTRNRKIVEERKMEREREKESLERIRMGKELMEARRVAEENERKRSIALRKAEKEEEKREREKIRKRLAEDKAELGHKLGVLPKEFEARSTSPVQERKRLLHITSISKAESMSNCLRSLKKNHKDEDAKVMRAFQTLLRYVWNVTKNPDVEKYRKIRLSNPTFQARVGGLKGGIEFLELCGFEKVEDGEFLVLPYYKVDINALNIAAMALNSALTNPFFGAFSSMCK